MACWPEPLPLDSADGEGGGCAGEAKSDLEIFTELARRYDFGDAFDVPMETLIGNVIEPAGITYEELKEKEAIDVVGPTTFPTRTASSSALREGRVLGTLLEGGGLRSHCLLRARAEDARNDNELARKYPLFSVQQKTYRSVHSTFNNLEWMDEVCDQKPVILMNLADAAARIRTAMRWSCSTTAASTMALPSSMTLSSPVWWGCRMVGGNSRAARPAM